MFMSIYIMELMVYGANLKGRYNQVFLMRGTQDTMEIV